MSTVDAADLVGPAEVLAARFHDRAEADAVRAKIEALGYGPDEVSYATDPSRCSYTFTEPGSHWARFAVSGAAIGGVGAGALGTAVGAVTLGSVAFLGPFALIAGTVIGGVVGLMTGAGMPAKQAQACERAIADGAVVMFVQTHAGDTDRVVAALGKHIIATESDDFTAATPTP
jgi:hypothetical protein